MTWQTSDQGSITVPTTKATLIVSVALLALVAACGDGGGDQEAESTPTLIPSLTAEKSAASAAEVCAATPQVLGSVGSPELIEISGIAASRQHDDVLWAHNDSGDTPRVFAMSMRGEHLATYALAGAEAIDWEDMAIGPGPVEGVDYLYLADIGDNDAVRPEIAVYRVREPDVGTDATPAAELADVEKLTLRYPGAAHDAETLLVDPVRGDLLIVTKEVRGGNALVFRTPGTLAAGTTATLEQVAEIDFSALRSQVQIPPDAPPLVSGLPRLATGGDVSPAGNLVAIRTYSTVWVWTRPEGAPLWESFAGAPCEGASTIEQQGEALGFDADGTGYITVSEGTTPPLNYFKAQ